MEKFTIDLDKVLDDFELQEDQEDSTEYGFSTSKILPNQETSDIIIRFNSDFQPKSESPELTITSAFNTNETLITNLGSNCENNLETLSNELSNSFIPAPQPEVNLNDTLPSWTQEHSIENEKVKSTPSIFPESATESSKIDFAENLSSELEFPIAKSNNQDLKNISLLDLLEENHVNQPVLSNTSHGDMLNQTELSDFSETELESYLLQLEQEGLEPISSSSIELNQPVTVDIIENVDSESSASKTEKSKSPQCSEIDLSLDLPSGFDIESDDIEANLNVLHVSNEESASESSTLDSDSESVQNEEDSDIPQLLDDPTLHSQSYPNTTLAVPIYSEEYDSQSTVTNESEPSEQVTVETNSNQIVREASILTTDTLLDPPSQQENDGKIGCDTPVEEVDSQTETMLNESSLDASLVHPTVEIVEGAVALEIEPYSSLTEEERLLGILKPIWTPDEDALVCMNCSQRFTVIRRRHHCRACGKVLCGTCCSSKARLEYMEGKESRVCLPCLQTLKKVEAYKKWGKIDDNVDISSSNEFANTSPTSPSFPPLQQISRVNPNNPAEYCSTIPPAVQAAGATSLPIPAVMVPVGVLKKEGSGSSNPKIKSEPKQVIFSDGIRPGGDLTELDAWRAPSAENYTGTHRVSSRRSKHTPPVPSSVEQICVTPKNRLVKLTPDMPPVLNGPQTIDDLKSMFANVSADPVVFVLQSSQSNDENPQHMLTVNVKLVQLDCCTRRRCWFFATNGMRWVSQDEIVMLIEQDMGSSGNTESHEVLPPIDILYHLLSIYEDARFKHHIIVNLGHTVTPGSFLGSTEHGGFLFFRSTFQCIQQLTLPPPPYLFGILLQRWEIPWAKVFPLRLLLRMGAEFRYYPCPLFSVRKRKSVFGEIGHTIINLLADMRNFSYTLPAVTGLVIHMEEHETSILLPKNRYQQVCKALAQSNDHVISLAASFSTQADAHLVCLQADDGSYQTQAINIHTRPRKVTGASFLVFNGALKSSSGFAGRSSIVEDGVMVQLLPDKLESLKQSLIRMEDFSIRCGKVTNEVPEETVSIKWVDQEPTVVNAGVTSPIDGRNLSGISSIRVMQPRDYKGEGHRLLRWTELFVLQLDDQQLSSVKAEENTDVTRLAESIAKATCVALTTKLAFFDPCTLVGIRISSLGDSTEYQAGANLKPLPAQCSEALDSSLIPLLHRESSDSIMPCVLELWFQIFHP